MSKSLSYLKPGIIFGDNIKKLFNLAKKKGFAIPAINCINTDYINAVLESASIVRSPVIIQFSYKGSAFFSGLRLADSNAKNSSVIGAISGAKYVHEVSKYYDVPIILHTDHCSKKYLFWLDELLKAGESYYNSTGVPLFSSHMIDLSKESINDNVKISMEYFIRMNKLGMAIEVEVGCIGGEEDCEKIYDGNNIPFDNILYASPKDIVYLCKNIYSISSNITIAASFGNVHGVHDSNKINLQPKILYNIQKYVSKKLLLSENYLNFVFHGGSGSSWEDIKESIKYGVVKLNLDTDIQWYYWKGVLNFYKKYKNFLNTQMNRNYDGLYVSNKKFYSSRKWIRCSQKSVVGYLRSVFFKLNSFSIF